MNAKNKYRKKECEDENKDKRHKKLMSKNDILTQ